LEHRRSSAYAAEFIGTFFLVFFICTILSLQHGGNGLGTTDFAVIGFIHVFALGMLIATLGGTSGAHFNPAVTITLTALRKLKPNDAVAYIVFQMLGGVAAALVVKLVLKDEGSVVNYGATGVSSFVGTDSGAFLCELIGTFVLMWAIMGTAVNERAERSWAPWIIGGTLGMAVMAIGPLTGAGFNPARAFGPALVGDAFGGFGTFVYVYVLGPIVGALAAGILYTKLVLVDAPAGPGERPIDKLA
jgi:glycerol uptake facilitator protein